MAKRYEFYFRVFLAREHKIHIFELTRYVLFTIYRHPDDGVFDDFSKISDHFPKISEDHTNIAEHFPKLFENFRRLPKTFEEDLKMFRSYTNESKKNLRDKLYSSGIIDILTSEDMENTPLESLMYFRMNFTSGVFSGKTLVSI